MHASTVVLCLLTGSALAAEPVIPLTGEDGQRMNEQLLFLHQTPKKAASGEARRKVAVFPGDNVIPHITDGGAWSSAITLANLDTRTIRVTVLFFRDDGSDLLLPIAGQGNVRGMRVTLDPDTTATFSTAGIASGTTSGWAYIQKEDAMDAVSGFCVFRQRVPGRPDFEAVVPIVSEFDTRAVLIYDNTNSFVTAAAFANPNLSSANITFTVRSEDGTVLERRTMTLTPYSHTAGTISGTFPSTVGRRGSIELVTSGTFGIGVVGLRFNPSGAFTSFHLLSNINWLL
jgi:hypothetical protein